MLRVHNYNDLHGWCVLRESLIHGNVDEKLTNANAKKTKKTLQPFQMKTSNLYDDAGFIVFVLTTGISSITVKH